MPFALGADSIVSQFQPDDPATLVPAQTEVFCQVREKRQRAFMAVAGRLLVRRERMIRVESDGRSAILCDERLDAAKNLVNRVTVLN